ncbi:TPA: ead/Ea22-like family protein [Escherichia coli]|nr:DUF551 domain-containing protein [Escherichia coli]
MSKIDYQALREAAVAIETVATPQKLLAFRMKVTPQVVLALLDERERNQQYIKSRDQENDGELSELTWCSHNQHHDDTLYVRADLVNGNSPVPPDSWISCSERVPAQDDWILIYSKHSEYMAGQVQGEYVELSDGTLSWLGNALYWMPLPEPPQEVRQ